MGKTRKKSIDQRVEQVLLWICTFGWTALLWYLLKSPQSAWIGWFTLVFFILALVATVILFNQDFRSRVITKIWRMTKPK